MHSAPWKMLDYRATISGKRFHPLFDLFFSKQLFSFVFSPPHHPPWFSSSTSLHLLCVSDSILSCIEAEEQAQRKSLDVTDGFS